MKKVVVLVMALVVNFVFTAAAEAAQYTGYGSAQNPNTAMGYRAAKVDAMRQAGGGGKVVSQGRLEDGTYYVTNEK